MQSRIGAAVFATAIAMLSLPAVAAQLPPIKTSASNKVPACITPGRLQSFLKSRNPGLSRDYEELAMYYMRHGEDLGIRWDMAFYQMVVETNTLRYTGDVDADQYNFAGLGATGGGVKGERFRNVSDGVRAHLEHVLMYTGTFIENPVAERTRKVQEWKVLEKFQRSIRGPITFNHLGTKWAPNDRGYSDDIDSISNAFNTNFCYAPDPRPELVAKARGTKSNTQVAANTAATKQASVTTLAPAATTTLAPAGATVINDNEKPAPGAGSLVGLSKAAQTAAKEAPAAGTNNKQTPEAKTTKTALAGTATNAAKLKPAKGKCRVWTASYGGAKAIIIKAPGDGITNYTVLDVHAGREKREAAAYIAAYAKGGTTIGEFDSPTAALDKAFELCPENK
ncbi:MAG: glucosaminidase domain-containing protein [Filomicrobium sp.]